MTEVGKAVTLIVAMFAYSILAAELRTWMLERDIRLDLRAREALQAYQLRDVKVGAMSWDPCNFFDRGAHFQAVHYDGSAVSGTVCCTSGICYIRHFTFD